MVNRIIVDITLSSKHSELLLQGKYAPATIQSILPDERPNIYYGNEGIKLQKNVLTHPKQ